MHASDARRWGWHRLDRSWAERVVAASAVAPGDLVLDVGAGDGSITDALVRVGARVIAIELHPDRVRALRRRFADCDVRVVAADAADLRLPRQAFGVVANPPFAVAMAVVRRLVSPGSRLVAADLVVPRHLAQRWCTGTAGGAGRWAAVFDVASGIRVPAQAFRPAAGRDAVVLRIRHVHLAVTPVGDRGRRDERSLRARRGPPTR